MPPPVPEAVFHIPAAAVRKHRLLLLASARTWFAVFPSAWAISLIFLPWRLKIFASFILSSSIFGAAPLTCDFRKTLLKDVPPFLLSRNLQFYSGVFLQFNTGADNSGMGHYHGHEGFIEMSKMKPVFKQSWLVIPLSPPYGKFLDRIYNLVKKLKWLN
jgi:hypothetical protein